VDGGIGLGGTVKDDEVGNAYPSKREQITIRGPESLIPFCNS
jgi:hypothetical protein